MMNMKRPENLQAQLEKALAECARLRKENQRLKTLLGASIQDEGSPETTSGEQLQTFLERCPERCLTPQNLLKCENSTKKDKTASLVHNLNPDN